MSRKELSRFVAKLPKICFRDTAYGPTNWSEDNPTPGHCAPTALLLHEMYGLQIVRTKFGNQNHHANRARNGKIIDTTKEQFGKHYPRQPNWTILNQKQIAGMKKNVLDRYARFMARFLALYGPFCLLQIPDCLTLCYKVAVQILYNTTTLPRLNTCSRKN